MTQSLFFVNEKRMRLMNDLKHQADRYTTKEAATNGLKYHTKPMQVVEVRENPDGILEGFYVVCPADAEKLHRATDGLITYAK